MVTIMAFGTFYPLMIKLMMLNRNIAIFISGQVERGRGESRGDFCQFFFFKLFLLLYYSLCFMIQPFTAAPCNLTEFLSAVSCATENIP